MPQSGYAPSGFYGIGIKSVCWAGGDVLNNCYGMAGYFMDPVSGSQKIQQQWIRAIVESAIDKYFPDNRANYRHQEKSDDKFSNVLKHPAHIK
jgi:hypothetical protein